MKFRLYKIFKAHFLAALLGGVVLLLHTHLAVAQPVRIPIYNPPTWTIPTLLEMVQNSDAIVVGKVSDMNRRTALIAVEQVLKGEQIPEEIEVTPTHGSTDATTPQLFSKQEEVLLFVTAGKDDDVWRISNRGWATINLRPETKQIAIEAVIPIVELPLGDQNTTNIAMLDWVMSDNYFLREQAQDYVRKNLSKPNFIGYKDKFLAMVSHPDADVRRLGLSELDAIQAPNVLPLFIKATSDSDASVRIAALNGLRNTQTPETTALFLKALDDPAPYAVIEAANILLKHDAPEAVTALAKLTQNPDIWIQIAAIRSLSASKRPEARDAIVALIDSPDVQVRKTVATALQGWVERDQADDVLPQLIALLKDPVLEVQTTALSVLDKSTKTNARLAVVTYRRLHS